MRLLLPAALILASTLLCSAQKNIRLPEKDSPPDIPLEPEATGKLLPRVETRPQTPPPAAGTYKPVPKVRLTPAHEVGETSLDGGQFRVHGKVKEQRDRMLTEAEATRGLVAAALRMDAAFRYPIVVQIRETSALRPGLPQVWSNILETDDGFRFEINVVPVNRAVPGAQLREELVRCLLAEMLLRDHSGADLRGKDAPPADWLLYGLLELLDYQSTGRPSEIFSAVFRLGHVLSVEDIFGANPRQMDSVSRMVYRSSCCGLLLLLMDKQNGQHLQDLFKILALMPGDDATAIARAYPELTASGNSLGKWWSLQLATMAQPGMDELLNTHDTESELTKALVVQLSPEPVKEEKPKSKPGALSKLFGKKKKEPETPEKKVAAVATPPSATACPIEEYTRILARKEKGTIFAQMELNLTNLAMRAHPLYRPVIGEYIALAKALGSGKREKEAATTLKNLAALRVKLGRDMQAMEDYVDWAEATQTEGFSDDFEDYLRAATSAAEPPAPRRDPISRYMNLMESEYKVEQ